jgi:hypothetical protein
MALVIMEDIVSKSPAWHSRNLDCPGTDEGLVKGDREGAGGSAAHVHLIREFDSLTGNCVCAGHCKFIFYLNVLEAKQVRRGLSDCGLINDFEVAG